VVVQIDDKLKRIGHSLSHSGLFGGDEHDDQPKRIGHSLTRFL